MELGLKEEEAFNVEALSPEMEATAMIRVTVRGLPNYRCVRHFPFSECRLLADGWTMWTAEPAPHLRTGGCGGRPHAELR